MLRAFLRATIPAMSLTRRTSFWLLLFGLLLAALLRLPALSTIPPGVHFDEAANGILASEIAWNGDRPIFITSYTGKEVLFFYVAALTARLVGPGAFNLRLAAAFLGLLTVAVTYWLGRVMLGDRRVALLAAILLATSFWHLLFSRLGFRAISQPLLQALAVGFLWQALNSEHTRQRWPRILLAGIALGLVAYTYLAARLFPVALFVGLLPFLNPLEERQQGDWRQRPGFILVIVFLVTAVVALPLFRFFFLNPETFWVRITQVGPTDSLALSDSYWQSLSMLFLEGDPYMRFNLPGRPVFATFWGAFLVIGWLLAIAAVFKTTKVGRRASYLFLVTLPFIMILPTALATNEIVPSNLRAIGLLPFLVFLPAYGFVQLLDSLAPQLPTWFASRQKLLQVSTFVVIGLMMAGWTANLYFQQWGQRADLFYETEGDMRAVSEFLNETALGDAFLYVGSRHYRHPAVALQADSYDRLKWLPNSDALVIPANQDAWYIYPHASPQPTWLFDYVDPSETVIGPPGPDGEPTFTAFFVPGNEPPGSFSVTDGNFGSQANLLELIVAEGQAGGILPVTLAWRVTTTAGGNYLPFLHLEDKQGRRWGQLEPFAYPAEQWTLGETVILKVGVPIPAGAPPQPYVLKVGFFDGSSDQQLARIDQAGRYAGTNVAVEPVTINPGPVPSPLPAAQTSVDEIVLDGLRLTGYERDLFRVSAGDTIGVSLWWLAQRELLDFTVRLELVRPDNTGIILANQYPVNGTFPASQWAVPQFLIDHTAVQIPIDTESGNYRLRLRVLNVNDLAVFSTDLGPLSVETSTRLFTAPVTSRPLAAVLSDEIALLGYDLEPRQDGNYDLRLVWQALQKPSDNYTVFVHLLDADEVCCLWQADLMPRQGTYPTLSWLANEVVVDEYVIELPDGLAEGDYLIEVGLFVLDTGIRLVVEQPSLGTDDKILLRPLRIAE